MSRKFNRKPCRPGFRMRYGVIKIEVIDLSLVLEKIIREAIKNIRVRCE